MTTYPDLTKALEIIKRFEGCSLTPYKCPAGVATIGYGTTTLPDGTPVSLSMDPITKKEAEEYLQFYTHSFYLKVNAFLSGLNINLLHHERQALTSFCYNLGMGPLTQSHRSLHQAVISKDRGQMAEAIKLYCKAGGVKLSGLVKRRSVEATLLLTGEVFEL